MNPAPLTPNAAGPWTQVRQGDKEFAPPFGKTVLCQALTSDGSKRIHFCARLILKDCVRWWQWAEGMEPRGLVRFERVSAWAEINP